VAARAPMLDAATFQAVALPQQDAATAYTRCQVPSGSRPVWCVVATLPRSERTAHAELHRRGFTAYLPLLTTRWRDRTWHTGPLFVGYCFVRIRLDQPWNPVRYAPGVFSLLSVDGIPSICPDAVLDALRAGEALRATPLPATAPWAPGMACKPATGPFQDHPAVVISVQRETATVAIMFLGHLRNVSVPLDCLKAREE
jgi:transcriptional antiterminator RfaH